MKNTVYFRQKEHKYLWKDKTTCSRDKTCPKLWNACYIPAETGEPKIGPTLLGGGRADGNLICASPPYLKFAKQKILNMSYTTHSISMPLRINSNSGGLSKWEIKIPEQFLREIYKFLSQTYASASFKVCFYREVERRAQLRWPIVVFLSSTSNFY